MEKVAITGGSGFLGRALVARLHQQYDLTVISRSEKAQLHIRAAYPGVRCLLGDVRDLAFLRTALREQDAVIHAAALKHVDISEREPRAYTTTNVQGTLAVLEVADRFNLEVVGVSTDKACEPKNVYGVTKLLMERLLAEYRLGASVRYGNVFGSDGSVLQRWAAEIKATGQISVTDPEMTRFFFRIQDAVDAVLWAWDHARARGVVVIPFLRSASLQDLAEAFIRHARGGAIRVIGAREGEKPCESLLSADEGRFARRVDGYVLLDHRAGPQPEPVPPILSSAAERIPVEELVSWLG